MADRQVDLYLETGAKRGFADASLWPGWSRAARDARRCHIGVLGARAPRHNTVGWVTAIVQMRQAALAALAAAARGDLPRVGLRHGLRWPPRFFVRRSGWHLLDHLWELEHRRVAA